MDVTGLKNRFRFRLGATSYIRPGSYQDNVAFLGALVDDVELLFFESSGPHALPQRSEVERLAELKREHGLSYTLHLPLDLHPGSLDEPARAASMEPCRRLVAATNPLEPLAWILHVPEPEAGARHREPLGRSIAELEAQGVARDRLCLENLDYPLAKVMAMVDDHAASLCLDIGHLLAHGFPGADALDAGLERGRVVHLHGLRGGKDHQEIGLLEAGLLRRIVEALDRPGKDDTVLTLEVFGYETWLRSMQTLGDLLP